MGSRDKGGRRLRRIERKLGRNVVEGGHPRGYVLPVTYVEGDG